MDTSGKCSLCSRTFARTDLRYTPVGGGVRNPYSDYLCRQCWAVLSNGAPWPEQAESGIGGSSPPSPDPTRRPPLDRRQAAALQQQQQQQQQYAAHQAAQTAAAVAAGSPLSMDLLQRSTSAPMSGLTAAQAVQYTSTYQQQLAAQQAAQQAAGQSPYTASALQQAAAGGGAAGAAMLGRRSQSFADFQHQGALPIGGRYDQQQRLRPWQPASMPEQQPLLGSSDDPRWGNLAASTSASEQRRAGRGHFGSGSGGLGMGGASAPAHHGLLAGSMQPQYNLQGAEVPGGMLDEASLELFESQSHLLDADSRAALAKQRQLLEWQQGSVGDEAHTLAASLERQDSAGSGNEPMEVSNIKRQLKTALAERDGQTQKANELQSQLQDKKRQLFSAIQEREGLRQQVRQLEDKCQDFQEALQCKICRTVQRNCVVLPCLHFLYCDSCIKRHCASTPSCPACTRAVTGFQTLMLHR
ncbi:E3 ubiquitin-ligase [Micractinium conductrix]|uniref:E3 ubiquitin-ligase n=1 Tax=Micractinium conductrix TaxID=554055 RepID=A0A2P6VBY2_9CHLO|nr:E3 ubiquitin-ligase [Micractinium conductrix]|eukprot:PSC71594.1 E3 ubiquitin-ligase [Micractinium conductrix]